MAADTSHSHAMQLPLLFPFSRMSGELESAKQSDHVQRQRMSVRGLLVSYTLAAPLETVVSTCFCFPNASLSHARAPCVLHANLAPCHECGRLKLGVILNALERSRCTVLRAHP
eukprot:5338934-Pleurochrysis_carterae.AAC.2